MRSGDGSQDGVGHHDSAGGAQDAETALEVEVDDAVVLVVGVVEEWFAHVDRRSADHAIDTAVTRLDVLEGSGHRGIVAQIDGPCFRTASVCGNAFGNLPCAVGIDIECDDERTVRGESNDDRFADAGSGADDRYDAVVERE